MNPTTFKAVIEKDHAKLAEKMPVPPAVAMRLKKYEQQKRQRQVAKNQTVGEQVRSSQMGYGMNQLGPSRM